MLPITHTDTFALVATRAAADGVPVGDVLLFAFQWLAAGILGAVVYYAVLLFIFRRRRHAVPAYRGSLLIALFLIVFAGGNLYVESPTFMPYFSLFAAPVQIMFLLFYYVFADRRYATRWARWLGLLYAFGQLFSFAPARPSQAPDTHHLPVPGVIGAITILGYLPTVLFAVIGLLIQGYHRYAHLVATGERPRVTRRMWLARGALLALGSFIALIISALLTLPPPRTASTAILYAQAVFYLLTTLLPVAAAFALLRPQPYDRDALLNRTLVYVPVTVCLLAIYAAGIAAARLFFPGFSALPNVAYIPFVIVIALLMAISYRPLRAQIQRSVDWRFYRRRYEAARILAAAGTSLRGEIHLDPMCKQLITAVQKALLSGSVTLWLRVAPDKMAQLSAALATLPTSADPVSMPTHANVPPDEIQLRWQAGTADAKQPFASPPALSIAPDDPARASLLRPSSVTEVARLPVESAAAQNLASEGARTVLPLVSQGALVGLLVLGPPPDAHSYTADERDVLTTFMDEITPRLRIVKEVYEQDVEIRERERVEQELQTARRIQESLLPKTVPALRGWRLATCYQPARLVGGDFYDFLPLADGQLGIVLGDVTDKGIPAALVMATTRSMLRAVATQRAASPGQVLAQVNELLCADLPASMFVTCFYAILDPASGRLHYANAGQDLPYVRHASGDVGELWATGMPLGLMPGTRYDEQETTLLPGDHLLFYSDGLVEAHSPAGEMFSFPRLMKLFGGHADGSPLIVFLLHQLAAFTGMGWEQEDDITLVTLQRLQAVEGDGSIMHDNGTAEPAPVPAEGQDDGTAWRKLDEWTLASEPGNERQAIERVAEIVGTLNLPPRRLEQLKTAVGEATMNAMEHGNHFQSALPVAIQVLASPSAVSVRITDQGQHTPLPAAQAPDLEAKLTGLQSPRGWGLFLIEHLVDEVKITGDESHHTVELIMILEEI